MSEPTWMRLRQGGPRHLIVNEYPHGSKRTACGFTRMGWSPPHGSKVCGACYRTSKGRAALAATPDTTEGESE